MSVETIIGAVTLILGASNAVLLWFQWRSASKVQTADATEKIGGAYDKLLDTMQKQIDELESDVTYMKKELAKYRNWTARLVKQLLDNNLIPVEPPDTGELKGHL